MQIFCKKSKVINLKAITQNTIRKLIKKCLESTNSECNITKGLSKRKDAALLTLSF